MRAAAGAISAGAAPLRAALPLRAAALLVLALSLTVFAVPTARAVVFHAKDEALALAFPGAERVESRTFILTDAQKTEVEKLARAQVQSQLWTVYVGWRGTELLGYAVIDSKTMRTLPATFMVVLSPAGEVRRVEILAFYEPAEYAPTERWTQQFAGRKLDDDMAMQAGIHGITGATLSATAVTAGVRGILALHKVLGPELSRGGN